MTESQILAVEELAGLIAEAYKGKETLEKPILFSLKGLSGTGKSHVLNYLIDELEDLGIKNLGDCNNPHEIYTFCSEDYWSAVRIAPVEVGEDKRREGRVRSVINKYCQEEQVVIVKSASPDELRIILAQDTSITEKELYRVIPKSLGSVELAKLLLSAPFRFPGRDNADDLAIAGFMQQLCPAIEYLPKGDALTGELLPFVDENFTFPDFAKIPFRGSDCASIIGKDSVTSLIGLGLTFKDENTWRRYTKFSEKFNDLWNAEPFIVVTAYLNDAERLSAIRSAFSQIENYGFHRAGIGKAGLISFEAKDGGKYAGYDVEYEVNWNGLWFPEIRSFDDEMQIVSGAPLIAQLAVGGHCISDKHIVLPSAFESHLQNHDILYHVRYPHNVGQDMPYSYLLYDPEKEICSELGANPESGSIVF